MHIPDGYLSLQTSLPAIGVMVPIWTIALNKVKKVLNHKQIPLLSLCAAFSFIIMMFNIPVGQSSVHAIGAVFVAILIGPWAACIAVSVALTIQALAFGDGGIIALGINCLNMAFVMPFAGYFIYKVISGKSEILSKRSILGIFSGSYFGINLAALFTAIELGIQPILFKAADGTPLYGYYPLSVSVPTMVFEHSIIAGPIEGIITVSAIAYLVKFAPHLINKVSVPIKENKSLFSTYKPFIICLGILALLTPLGLLATGTAWGEWGVNEIKEKIGYIPAGFSKFSDIWKAFMPDYVVRGFEGNFIKSSIGYIISAIFGVLLITVVILITSKLAGKDKKVKKRIIVEKDFKSDYKIPQWMLEKQDYISDNKKTNIRFLKNTFNGISKVMRNEVFSEKFAVNGKIIQRIDPRIKLLTILFFMVFSGLTRQLPTLAFLTIIAVLYVKLSGLKLKDYFKRIWLVLPVIVLLLSIPAATNLFISGKALFYIYKNLDYKIWFIKFPEEIYFSINGLVAILKMAMRLGVSFSFGYLLVMTTRWAYLTKSFKILKIPGVVITILNLTYRYIYVLSKITSEMIESRFLRTIGHSKNKQNRNYISGRISHLFIKSSYLSEEIFDSMRCRGYTGESVSLKVFKIQKVDFLWVINNLIIILILLMGEIIF